MSEQEGQGFVIRDRRGRGPDEEAAAGQGPAAAGPGRASEASGEAAEAARQAGQGPPISFSSFAFSLGTSALMLMGEKVDPNQPDMPANPGQAKEIVDILSVLEEKTRGNLNAREDRLMEDILFDLRMKYVEAVKKR